MVGGKEKFQKKFIMFRAILSKVSKSIKTKGKCRLFSEVKYLHEGLGDRWVNQRSCIQTFNRKDNWPVKSWSYK